ncbi:MAG: dihydroorotase [Candidatus Dormibacteria bacterium]
MSELLLQGVRLIDPFQGLDLVNCDLWLRDGVVLQVGERLEASPEAVRLHRPGSVVAPSFLDLHCHLREPGEPWKERVSKATAAAAAGGFGAICAMANLAPPVDQVERLRACQRENQTWGKVPVMQFAACTEGLAGAELTDIPALTRAGAAGFSDDGRNGMSPQKLAEALRQAADLDRLVAVHPEDEALLELANPGSSDPTGWRLRPPAAEVRAVEGALGALRFAGRGRLHLQHLTTAASVELVRRAKADGLTVTAEVTPHHLMLTGASSTGPAPTGGRCNPPLRTEADRTALWEGLLDGTVDAVASDHAPHEAAASGEERPGFSGVQAVLPAVLGQGGALAHLGRILEALSLGPHRVLGAAAEQAPGDGIRAGEAASCTWFDPSQSWTPGPSNWLSLGSNTPFWGRELRGAVLATFTRGRLVHLDRERLPELGDG